MMDDQLAILSWCRALSEAHDQICITVTAVGLLMCGVLADERTCVVYSCCWASPARSFLSLCPIGLHYHTFLSQIWNPGIQPGRPCPLFVSPRNMVAQLYPQALGFTHSTCTFPLKTCQHRLPEYTIECCSILYKLYLLPSNGWLYYCLLSGHCLITGIYIRICMYSGILSNPQQVCY
jgi:hypothetical protein